ncbi:MAG: hypothetical protein F4Z04_07825 [Acidobacteria bacterium]|nr:hypothetical protein [Acidobacteriota bacterium]
MLVEKLRAAYRDPKRGRWLRWGLGAYGAVALACTAAWLIVGPQAAERTGLRRELFLGNGFAGQPFRDEVSENISLDFLAEDERLRRYFSVRWRGYWYVPESGPLEIHGAGDDWLNIYIDGDLVLRRYPPNDMHRVAETVNLDAGAHELLVEYQQEAGSYVVDVRSSPPSGLRRPLAGHRLFLERPSMEDVRLAERASWLGWAFGFVWVAPLLVAAGFARRWAWRVRDQYGPTSPDARHWRVAERTGLAVAIGAIVVQTVRARLAGWNPESLWSDDLVYGAIIRSQDVWSMISAPIHVAPGPFLIWRGLYALLPDPEWSLQLLPFFSGVVAIPVMALLVWSLTRDTGLAVLAAALTALNPLLAHYTVFVHQYPFDFLVTALLLIAAALLVRNGDVDPPRFGWLALGGGLAAFFSVTSVFLSFPAVNLGAALAARGWRHDRTRTTRILLSAAAYNAAVLAAYLFLSARSNPLVREDFAFGFIPLASADAAWDFLARNGRYLLELGLPSWGEGPLTNPETVSWPLPFLALGLIWLLARRSTRFFGLVVLGFYAAFLAASALQVYPMGTGRADIFAFPLSICLAAVGVQLATEALPARRFIRMAAAIVVLAIALARPLQAVYFNVDDAHLVDHLAANLQPEDGLILSPSGSFLVAFYGDWPVRITATDRYSHGTMATIGRDRTHYLFREASEARSAERFVAESRPDRVWYVAFRTGTTEQIVQAIERQGYSVHPVKETRRGTLYLAEHN